MNERFLGVCCQLYTLLNLFRVYNLTQKQTTKKKKQSIKRNQKESISLRLSMDNRLNECESALKRSPDQMITNL